MNGIDVGILFFVTAPIVILTVFAVYFISQYKQAQSGRESGA